MEHSVRVLIADAQVYVRQGLQALLAAWPAIIADSSSTDNGELAQLSGRPALVDARAKTNLEALLIAPERLRAVLIAEAELGERIMRALILRRVSLIQGGAGGPVLIGPSHSAGADGGSSDFDRTDEGFTRPPSVAEAHAP